MPFISLLLAVHLIGKQEYFWVDFPPPHVYFSCHLHDYVYDFNDILKSFLLI